MTPIWKNIYDQLPSFRKQDKSFCWKWTNDSLLGRSVVWISNFGRRVPGLIFTRNSTECFGRSGPLSSWPTTLSLRPRLTTAATHDLLELNALMMSVELDASTTDKRVLRSNGKIPTSRDHYLLSIEAYLEMIPSLRPYGGISALRSANFSYCY